MFLIQAANDNEYAFIPDKISFDLEAYNLEHFVSLRRY